MRWIPWVPSCAPIRGDLICCLIVSLFPAMASSQTNSDDPVVLPPVAVRADPLLRSPLEQPRPVTVLAGTELDRRRSGTVADSLGRTPGVQSSAFGPAVGRPIIRGLGGPRIQILEDGVGTLDVSDVSVDHGLSVDPLFLQRIEVIRGPAALLYGGGAVGGVVNLITARIPEMPLEGRFEGLGEIRGDTAADTRAGAARLSAQTGSIVWSVDGFARDSDDLSVPDEAVDDDESGDTLENSDRESLGGSVGASVVGGWGFAGLAVSRYETEYGIPGGHAHGHEDDHEEHEGEGAEHGHGHEGAHGHDDHEADEEEESVRLDLEQTRLDFAATVLGNGRLIDRVRVRLGLNDYEHVELEGAEVGTRFDNEAWEGRAELVHGPLGSIRGVVGVQASVRDFSAIGEEAFVPPSETARVGIFFVEEWAGERLRATVGARAQYQDIEVQATNDRPEDSRDDEAFSISAGLVYSMTPTLSASAYLARSERIPVAEELFSNGPHAATQSFEVGDRNLDTETALSAELGLRYSGDRWRGSLNLYRYDFEDYIFLRGTGEIEDGLPVRLWSQDDAVIQGLEGEVSLTPYDGPRGKFGVRLFGDLVLAELDRGDDLPRTPPARVGLETSWQTAHWFVRVDLLAVAEQTNTAPGETETDGYNLLGVNIERRIIDAGDSQVTVFAGVENLLDETARVHTSFLKEEAPLAGRNVTFGIRGRF